MEFIPRSQTEKQSPASVSPTSKENFGVHDFLNYYEEEGNDHKVSETEKTAHAVIEALRHTDGILYKDVGAMYPLVQGKILVRREDVGKVMESILEKAPVQINARGVRPNVAWWDITHGSDGLKNAFLEGHTHMNGVVSVLGFEPSESLVVTDQKDIPDEPNVFISPDGGVLDRHFVASAHGATPYENVRFAVFRFPYEHFPEEELTDEEVGGGEKNPDGTLKYVFRGVYFPKEYQPMIH